MGVELYNGWYVSTPYSAIGPSSGTSTAEQIHNAEKIYYTFISQGWTVNAISAMIGNMNYESNLNPARVYKVGNFPHGGASLTDLDNNNALNHPNEAYGLVQWKGKSSAEPITNQLVSYAIRYNTQWYDGDIQIQRLLWEYSQSVKFHAQTVDGVYWTFEKFSHSTADPQTLSKVWMVCYEGTWSVLDTRKKNAQKWYNYFHGSPEPPDPTPEPEPPDPTPPDPGPEPIPTPGDWITGDRFAEIALSFDPNITGIDIPYSELDCIQFVNKVWQKIPVVYNNGWSLTGGTNSLWRSTYRFNTTDPYGYYPTLELWYKNTLRNTEKLWGYIPTGSLLFHQIDDNGPPEIPSQYAGDGIGNFVHVGIYCGNKIVMQSGGKDSGAVPGGGVHKSTFDRSAWNYVAFVCWVNPAGELPPEPTPTGFNIVNFVLSCYDTKRKNIGGFINGKRCF